MSDATKITAFYTGQISQREFRRPSLDIEVDVTTLKSSSSTDTTFLARPAESQSKVGTLRFWVVINGGLYEADFQANVV